MLYALFQSRKHQFPMLNKKSSIPDRKLLEEKYDVILRGKTTSSIDVGCRDAVSGSCINVITGVAR